MCTKLMSLKYFDDHQAVDADEDSDDMLEDSDNDDDSLNGANETVLDDGEEEQSVVELTFGESISCFWLKCREKLITPFSITGQFCSPDPDIRKDVEEHEIGANRLDMEAVIEKIFYPLGDVELGEVIQTFWSEFGQFQMYSHPFFGLQFSDLFQE